MSPLQMCMIIVIAIAAVQSQALQQPEKVSCQALVAELRAMKQAEKTLLTNMVQNNDTMASTLDQYAVELKDSASHKKPVTTKDVKSLKQSAQAFRQHKAREQRLISKFDSASATLIDKVQSCLNH